METEDFECRADGARTGPHGFTNPAADARGMKGFFYHADPDRRSWNGMIDRFNETLK